MAIIYGAPVCLISSAITNGAAVIGRQFGFFQ